MSPRRVCDTPDSFSTLWRSVLGEGKASILLFWRVFWKVTAGITALLFFLFFSLHRDDLSGPLAQVVFGMAAVFGYCFFCAFWVGLGAGTFAIAWRWCGAWIIVPIVGALFGAAAAVGLAFVILRSIDFRGAGPHGGGDIAAFLLLGFLAVSAVIGAIGGGVLAGVPALIVALTTRRFRQANADTAKLQSATYDRSPTPSNRRRKNE